MQEFKGTPGPWHVSNEGCMLIRDDAGLSIVAKYVGYTNDEEELANARLIAAAPELLVALQSCVEWLDIHSCAGSAESICAEESKLIIAKALGK